MKRDILFQCFDSITKEFGPVIFCYQYEESNLLKTLEDYRERMNAGEYVLCGSSARLTQQLIGNDQGAGDFGIINVDHILNYKDLGIGNISIVLINAVKQHELFFIGEFDFRTPDLYDAPSPRTA